VHGPKSVGALISYLVGTASLLWGISLTIVPWEPRNKYQAAMFLAPIFALSLALLFTAWKLVRVARIEIAPNEPQRWRLTDYVLCGEALVCGLYILLTFFTVLT
jgi:hypothetical protein